MPTARELLEQADALMRRNRSAAADDIPVLTEAVSPQPVLRVPLRPSPESPPPELPADDVEAAPDVIPTLTEKVPAGEPPREGAVLAEGEPSDWLEFDEGEPSITGRAPSSVLSVPEVVTAEALREAADAEAPEAQVTEEIELAPAAEADFEAELGGGPPAAAEPGEAMSAEAMPAEAMPADAMPADATSEETAPTPADVMPAARSPWTESELPPEVDAMPALAAEAEMVFDSPSSVSWNVEAVLAGPEDEAKAPAPAEASATAESVAAASTPTPFAATPATEADEPALDAPVAAAPLPEPPLLEDEISLLPSPAEAFAAAPVVRAVEVTDSTADDASATGVEPIMPAAEPVMLEAAPAAAVVEPEAPEVEPGAIPHAAVADASPLVAAAAPVSAAPADDARWEAMAEEIRMQVLQRIDLFTDTGLREQLGLRLQPIVDRASADLVRTINQHVGELLRAYVAEAIEREIERWRSSQP